MAQKTIVTLVDDLTGEEAEDITTVEFALDGVTYEIDLDDKNSARLRDALAEYVAAARRTGGRRSSAGGNGRRRSGAGTGTPRATSPGGYDRETSKQIREWAKGHGFEVSDRGRVPNNVVEAWEAQRKGSDHAASFSG
ncbi:histone-like nucleoid-structuring protein Lsr2 [Actinomycetospora callitridis]|uniref:histone-like nucleoid-structuring protein Lsr2 n=1 Tax=Actinomycetospora callitridis TaxID=913944 RepID=UPI0023668DDD|nr:Lsr2 family protein [Actinomycetospora callitridis]MDD7921326.1 Lsr2 family protein [Actinomycetospora callitridis]